MEDADEKALYGSYSRSNPMRPGHWRWHLRQLRYRVDHWLIMAPISGDTRDSIRYLLNVGPFKAAYTWLFYRHHMRLIHRFGWGHAMRRFGPGIPDGKPHKRCDWCGHMEQTP